MFAGQIYAQLSAVCFLTQVADYKRLILMGGLESHGIKSILLAASLITSPIAQACK